ncbi:angiotensin-converting enzyme-like isoform X2 [Bradysia coprophila]|uniref:angiotensin-converting enzyme-like isoform X2 n=1 Tax=Bradysia coprophila TaxID=38358 RepID=UPI00187DB5E3|nr:angiotensin-converting enzyme-like isoform X2 [Bradysia coprophila]
MFTTNRRFLSSLMIILTCNGYIAQQPPLRNINDVDDFIRDYNREAAEMCNRVATIEWKYETNSSDYNRRRMNEQQSIAAKFECLSWKRAASFDMYRLFDTSTKKQLEKILRHGKCGLDEDKYQEITHVITVMKDAYKSAKICPYRPNSNMFASQSQGQSRDNSQVFGPQGQGPTTSHVYGPGPQGQGQITSHAFGPPIQGQINPHAFAPPQYNEQHTDPQFVSPYTPPYMSYCDLRLDPELIKIMEVSRNQDELLYIWAAYHEKVGSPLKNSFMRYVDLANQAARIHGFRDAGEQMRSVYEDNDLYFTVQDLWARVQPLYKKLFTFVRKGLVRKYGETVIRRDGPIPAHLLGNMWGQNWKNILDIIRPEFPETPDVTGEMVRQGYNPLKIFQSAEEFFTSMGLPPMSPEFWRNSMLSNNDNGYIHCKASAWDFCNNIDFRIKQCTQITVEDFVNAHHEMTHIQYYMQYSGQPFVYRDGPNPAFHDAMAHTIGLSVGGPVHLQRLGLLSSPIPTSTGNSLLNIEYLLDLALDKLPFMAFSVALEKWRWLVFEKGPIGLNARWWDLRLRYQGIVPPTQRTHEHFDAASKYHIISDQDYIKYFIATILQFQIFAELCQASGHVGQLHTCDIYRSREAGRLISELMQQGASLSSSQLIRMLTRGKTSRLSAEPLLDYFRPLEVWLEQQIIYEPVVGWNSNLADIALFQYSASAGTSFTISIGLIFCTVLLPHFF